MDVKNDYELILQKYTFTISNGEKFIVKPAPWASILDEENGFSDELKGLEVDSETNPRLNIYLILRDEKRREKLNNLMLKYCSYNNSPLDIEKAIGLGWGIDDIIIFIKMLIGISGASLSEDNSKSKNDSNDNSWIYIYNLLRSDGNLPRDEILNTSLPLLNGQAEEIIKSNANKALNSFGGFMPQVNENKESSESLSGAEFAALFN